MRIMLEKIRVVVLRENMIAFFLALVALSMYVTTMNRHIGPTDAGELTSVISSLGIAHPTGYPLFTLLGHVWMLLPLGGAAIIRANLLAALLTAMAVGLFFKVSLQLFRSHAVFGDSKKQHDRQRTGQLLGAGMGSLVVAFATTFWSQSTGIEVYPLHLALLQLAILFFLRGVDEQRREPDVVSRSLCMASFVLALSFSNHMTTIFLAPAFLWIYFATLGFTKRSFFRCLILVPIFFLGLSTYLYLFLRSQAHPLLNWGNPETLQSLFWHVSAKQFRVWMFSDWTVAQKQITYLWSHFFSEYNIIAALFILLGIFSLLRFSRKRLWFLGLLALADVLYAVNYDIHDIDSYFLLFFLVCGWLLVFGAGFLFQVWASGSTVRRAVEVGVLALVFVIQVVGNYREVDSSSDTLQEEFVHNSFAEMPPHAIVFSGFWDYYISPAWYYQYIRGERKDITVIDISLLQNRVWYFTQLERFAPQIVLNSRMSIDSFLEELRKFEQGEPFDGSVIQSRWMEVLGDIVEKSYPNRPVYVDARIQEQFPTEYKRIPSGLFVRLVKKGDTVSVPFFVHHFTRVQFDDPVGKDFMQYYSFMLSNECVWLAQNRRFPEAQQAVVELLRINPQNADAQMFLDKLQNK